MCLLALAIGTSDELPLVVASNRDEFFARPTAAASIWQMANGVSVLSGRDLVEGGTWLGVSHQGRVAMLTNVRQGVPSGTAPRSRGAIVAMWLAGDTGADELLDGLNPADFGGFNLIIGDLPSRQWRWVSNRDPENAANMPANGLVQRSLAPGIYGLSNAALDTPWSKTVRLRQSLFQAMSAGEIHLAPGGLLGNALSDMEPAAAVELPQTGVSPESEIALSSPFVRMPQGGYGTRCSTLLQIRRSLGASSPEDWTAQLEELTHAEPVRVTETPSGQMMADWSASSRTALSLKLST